MRQLPGGAQGKRTIDNCYVDLQDRSAEVATRPDIER
jgi:hypothetical protein